MINKIERVVTRTIKDVKSITCDRCMKEYSHIDIFEIQEFTYIRIEGWHGSVFGDSANIECDICQHCMLEMIKGIYREVV